MIGFAPGEARAGDRGVADAAAAEHRDAVAAADVAGVHRRAEAGHHAAAEQARRPRAGPRGRPWWPGPRRRASARRTRRCRARARAAVPSVSVIFCVALKVAKQYQGRPRRHARQVPHTARQLRITKSPGATLGDVGPDRLDDARRLVAEQEREVVVDRALAVVQVGVAHAARLHRARAPHPARGRARRSSRTSTGAPLRERDHTPHRCCSHGVCLPHVASSLRSVAGCQNGRPCRISSRRSTPTNDGTWQEAYDALQRVRVAHRRRRSTCWPTPRTGSVVPTRPSPPTSAPTSSTSPTATGAAPRSRRS